MREKENIATQIRSQANTIKLWVSIIAIIAAAVFYLDSFEKKSDAEAAISRVAKETAKQRDTVEEIKIKLGEHGALLEHIDEDLHELIKRR